MATCVPEMASTCNVPLWVNASRISSSIRARPPKSRAVATGGVPRGQFAIEKRLLLFAEAGGPMPKRKLRTGSQAADRVGMIGRHQAGDSLARRNSVASKPPGLRKGWGARATRKLQSRLRRPREPGGRLREGRPVRRPALPRPHSRDGGKRGSPRSCRDGSTPHARP